MGILGDAVQQARQFQGLAAVQQQMRQQQEQADNMKLGTTALQKYRESLQAGTPDENSMTTALIYHPEAAKNVLAHIGIQDKQQKTDAASFAIRAASIADDPQAFNSALDARIAYLQQSGRNPADSMRLKEIYSQNPEAAKKELKGVAAALVGDGTLEKAAFDSAFGPAPGSMNEYQKASLELDKQRLGLEQQRLATGIGQLTADERNWNRYQELLKTDPKQARQFGVAKGFVSNEGQKLSVFDSKVIDTASNEYTKLSSSASNYRMLADKIKAANLTSGAMGTLQELGKEFLGEQDTNTGLRKAVAQIVASEASKNLNPGSTTEREYAIAREPMPTGKANSEYVARWLTAVANVAEHNAKFQEHKAQFISKNGGQRDPDTGETVLSSWKRIQSEQTPTDSGQLFKDADAIIGGQ